MKINELVQTVKDKGAYSKRRVKAVAAHGKNVVTTGLDAAGTVVSVLSQNLNSAVSLQKQTLADSSLPITAKLRAMTTNVGESLATTKVNAVAAAMEGYRLVSDKLGRVADVTKMEHATEKKIEKKAKKARKMLSRAEQT